jgi:phage tail-like protein
MPNSVEYLGGDPPVTNRFLFEVDGIEIGIFKEVSGLEVKVDVLPISEGGQNGYIRQVPGKMSWPPIVFKRGLTRSDALLDWLSKTSGEGFAGAHNKVDRHTGAITAITLTGTRLRSWELHGVMPVRWKGPTFSVETTSILEEELEIVHDGFRSKTYGSA